MHSNPEISPENDRLIAEQEERQRATELEERRLVADLNDPGMVGAFEIMRRLQRLQLEEGLPQKDIADAMGTGQSAVSEMFNLEVMPRLDIAVRLAHALGATLQVAGLAERPYISRKFNYPPPDKIVVRQKESTQTEPTAPAWRPQVIRFSRGEVVFRKKGSA